MPRKVPLGQRLYRGGDPKTGIAACAACHGPARRRQSDRAAIRRSAASTRPTSQTQLQGLSRRNAPDRSEPDDAQRREHDVRRADRRGRLLRPGPALNRRTRRSELSIHGTPHEQASLSAVVASLLACVAPIAPAASSRSRPPRRPDRDRRSRSGTASGAELPRRRSRSRRRPRKRPPLRRRKTVSETDDAAPAAGAASAARCSPRCDCGGPADTAPTSSEVQGRHELPASSFPRSRPASRRARSKSSKCSGTAAVTASRSIRRSSRGATRASRRTWSSCACRRCGMTRTRMHARVFYTAEAARQARCSCTRSIFREIHVNGNPLNTVDKITAFFKQHGVSNGGVPEGILLVRGRIQAAARGFPQSPLPRSSRCRP